MASSEIKETQQLLMNGIKVEHVTFVCQLDKEFVGLDGNKNDKEYRLILLNM